MTFPTTRGEAVNKLISLLAVAFAVTAGNAYAADGQAAVEKKPTAQQVKMKTCNKEAREKGLKKEERRKFMSGCLKGDKQ